MLLLVPVALAVAFALMQLAPRLVELLEDEKPVRPGMTEVFLSAEGSASPVGSDGGFQIVMTEKEALATFDKAKKLFTEYRDEAALVEINRLLSSNATRQVKAKAQTLAQYVREPSFLSMPDRFEYADVMASPALYEGVGVVWKGLPANSRSSADSTAFDLLVGYHDKKRLEGIVPVRSAFLIELTPDQAIEVLARIHSDGKGIYLECLAIHELAGK